jgi:hypothetical protein
VTWVDSALPPAERFYINPLHERSKSRREFVFLRRGEQGWLWGGQFLVQACTWLNMQKVPSVVKICLLLPLLVQGCTNPRADLAQFDIPTVRAEEPRYRERAVAFIQSAQAGDVDQMLDMTSKQSYATQGISLHELYADQVVPHFRGAVVTWRADGKPFHDENYVEGLYFTGTVRGQKTSSFEVYVLKEDGKLVVSNIKARHWYNW